MPAEMRRHWISNVQSFFLDTLFPVFCLGCGRSDIWLCADCLEHLSFQAEQLCPICERKITPAGRTCFECRRKYSIDGLLVAASYKNRLVARLVQLLKYRFVSDLSEPLGKLLVRAAHDQEIPLPDLIVPVPLHSRRLRWRGFNQATLIASHISPNLAPGFTIPIAENILLRTKYTHPQMKIKNFRQRRKNIQGVFRLNEESEKIIEGKYVWLVDDVATTGSTIFECARTLKYAGAREVFGLVIARQEMKK